MAVAKEGSKYSAKVANELESRYNKPKPEISNTMKDIFSRAEILKSDPTDVAEDFMKYAKNAQANGHLDNCVTEQQLKQQYDNFPKRVIAEQLSGHIGTKTLERLSIRSSQSISRNLSMSHTY
jgi:hypothetical protein